MSERPTEPYVAPREPTLEEGGSSMAFGYALFGISLLLAVGTVGVALIYLALD